MSVLFPDHIQCKPCGGGGFVGDSGDMAEDACRYCGGLGSVLPENAAIICDYCESIVEEVSSSPFMADVGANMCRGCWGITRADYLGTTGEDIGGFKAQSIR